MPLYRQGSTCSLDSTQGFSFLNRARQLLIWSLRQRGARDIATKASTLCLAAWVQGNFLGCLVRFHLWILLVKPGLPLNEPMHPESAPAICVRQVFVNLAAFGITEGCFRDDCRSLTVAFADFARCFPNS